MVKVKWLGHSAFEIKSGEFTLLVDPFITGNPQANCAVEDICADYILLTHGHGDHVGDGFAIAKKCDATIIAPNELAVYAGQKGLKTHPMHIGGAFEFPFGRVKLTPAFHGSAIVEEDGTIVYTGMPCGFLIDIDGKTIYHAGDTGLHAEMMFLGDFEDIELALLPIGDNFTMGPRDAAIAVDMIDPKIVVPMHYGTWPPIDSSPEDFADMVDTEGVEVKIMKPGGVLEI